MILNLSAFAGKEEPGEFTLAKCRLKLELDSTLSQSRIEFWNWILNVQFLKSKS